MRVAAAVSLSFVLIACSNQTASPPASPEVNRADTPAADLRTHLDLLLAEHVMIVAKESEAAAYHSDEYAPYTALLTTNSLGLQNLMGRALGSTAGAQFGKLWDQHNGFLVDYAIGVVTHSDDKANAATAKLTGPFVQQFGEMIGELTGLSAEAVAAIAKQQVMDAKAVIDDISAGSFANLYSDLHNAYLRTSQLGDPLAVRIVAKFPDRFPGAPRAPAVEARLALNLQLQEQSYLATMATDALVAKRDAEKAAAVSALASNSRQLDKAWADWDLALFGYATGTGTQPASLIDRLATATGAAKPAVQFLVRATTKVIDDQRSNSSQTVADDDREAATAMQPIADASDQG